MCAFLDGGTFMPARRLRTALTTSMMCCMAAASCGKFSPTFGQEDTMMEPEVKGR